MSWWRRTPSRIRTLPSNGTAVVVSDLHGHWDDFLAVLEKTDCERRLRDEDLYLILTGDVPDTARHRSIDPSVPPDGDVRILDRLLALREDLGPRAERVIYLEGNHDFHVARICREIAEFAGDSAAGFDPQARAAYFQYYRVQYGDPMFANNIGPYDMVARARPEHVAWFESCPILAVAPGCGLTITHAGPPTMRPWTPRALRKAIERARPESLHTSDPAAYYGSPYHQLLNNRFRHGDYGLEDVEEFLEAMGGRYLVTGHTPHTYLVDLEQGRPYPDCAIRDGVGLVGPSQLILCTSFGAFAPSTKRYLEIDLAGGPSTLEGVLDAGVSRPVYTPEEAAGLLAQRDPLPGFELAMP